MPQPGRLPTLHVAGETIPQAYYRAIEAVWHEGALMPTQYDRKDANGNLIDPPGRDARVLIEVADPFRQPRFPPISHCEIGTYIAEIMGVKDHRVIPMSILKKMVDNDDLTEEEESFKNFWPYTYHQRLSNHPEIDSGDLIDQLDLAVRSVAKTPYTRRAICSTAVPNLDPYLTEDIPCLRELALRCPEDDDGNLVLNPSTTWRSRDLYKAWGDNAIGLSFLFARLADRISSKCGRSVKVGSYADYSISLHIYGQDFSHVGGDESKGLAGFFETFPDEYAFMDRSLTSDVAAEMFVIPQLEKLLTAESIAQWDFPPASIDLISDLIDGIESGRYIC